MLFVHCPRHGGPVLLGTRAITGITNLTDGVIAVELRCPDGERLFVLAGATVAASRVGRPVRPRRFELVVGRQDVADRLLARDPGPHGLLPSTRPDGVLKVARALRDEMPELGRPASLRVAIRARLGHSTVALVGSHAHLSEIAARLRGRGLVSAVEPA